MRFRTIAADGVLPADADDKLHAFLAYWRAKCPPHGLPRRGDIDPTEIPHLLAAILLVDVEGGDFRFRLAGQDLVQRYGNLRGRSLGELMSGRELADTLAEHRRCVTARLPVYSENTIRSAGAGDWFLYQRLLVPLDSGGTVNILAGVMSFRSFRADDPAPTGPV